MLILCIDKPHIKKKFGGKDVVNYEVKLSLQAFRQDIKMLA